MSKIARFAVAVAALASLFGALSATAGAVTWHNTGSTAFTATGGPMTISRGATSFACAGSSATAAGPGGSTVDKHSVFTGTLTMSPCTLAGQASTWHCNFTLTGITQLVPGVTSGGAILTCVMRFSVTGTSYCHVEGATPVSYTNPSGSTAGRITLPASTTLVVTNSTAACPLGTGSSAFSGTTITVTNGTPTTLGPILTRTA